MRVPPIAGPSAVECTPMNIHVDVASSKRTTSSSPPQPRRRSSSMPGSLGPSVRTGRSTGTRCLLDHDPLGDQVPAVDPEVRGGIARGGMLHYDLVPPGAEHQ